MKIERKKQSVDKAYVLDSFALLAHLEGEARGKKVTEMLTKAKSGKISLYISLINLGEVYYIILRERGAATAEETIMLIEQLPLKIAPADRDMVFEAAKLKAKYPIAYADCFACALAIEKNAKVITGDPEFKRLGKDISVLWI